MKIILEEGDNVRCVAPSGRTMAIGTIRTVSTVVESPEIAQVGMIQFPDGTTRSGVIRAKRLAIGAVEVTVT